jgi:Flp pilus assembly pilin Flp
VINSIVLSVAAWASSLRSSFVERLKEESGQDLMEYAVLAGAIAIVAGGALFAAGFNFTPFTTKVGACISFDTTNCKP